VLGALTVTEDAQLQMGIILAIPGKTCALDASTELLAGEACLDSANPVSAAQFTISDQQGSSLTLSLITHPAQDSITLTPYFPGNTQAKGVILSTSSIIQNVGGEVSFSAQPLTIGNVSLSYSLDVVLD